jgi:hypothetical protein
MALINQSRLVVLTPLDIESHATTKIQQYYQERAPILALCLH